MKTTHDIADELLALPNAPRPVKTMNKQQTSSGLRDAACSASCCFNCKHWIGTRRRDRAYCHRLNLSGKDAPRGSVVCVMWEKRINSRMQNARCGCIGGHRHSE